MNTTSEIRQAFMAFRVKDHTTPDDTLRWCKEACLACAGIPDPAAALTQAREALVKIIDVPAVHFTADVIDNASRTMDEVRKIARAALAALEGRAQP